MILYLSTIYYKKVVGIYKITNPKGRVYIGQSINVENRIQQYRSLINCKTQRKLYNSLKKYGPKQHCFNILEECNVEDLNTRERYYQDLYKCLENGLNCILTTSNSKSGKNSLESNLMRSRTMKGKNTGPRPDVSERNKIVHKGKSISEEHKLAISKKLKGKTRSYTGIRGEHLRKPVLQLDKNTGKIIKEFISLTEAGSSVNRGAGDIHRVLSGRGKTCAGYKWRYKENNGKYPVKFKYSNNLML